jgi:sugar phosphate isomerase/epimerase
MRDFSTDHSALALNTATLGHNLDGHGAGWSPEQVIDACAERGYGGITFWRREIGTRAQDIGDRVRAAGMQVTGLCRTPFLTGPLVPGNDGAIMNDFHASIDMAAGLGTEVLTIVAGGIEPGSKGPGESQKILADRIARAVDYAAERDVCLALEPLNPVYGGDRSCVMTVRDALAVCDLVGAKNLGVAVDVYHVWWDMTLPDALQDATGLILGYHLCDWLAETRDVLLDRGMMGDGVADLKAIRRWVEAAGYRGFCEVEVFSAETWWQRDPGEVLDVIVERFRTEC